jgi:hypothetical protein
LCLLRRETITRLAQFFGDPLLGPRRRLCGGRFEVTQRYRGLCAIFVAALALILAGCGAASTNAIKPGGSAIFAPTARATVTSVCAKLQPTPDTSGAPYQVVTFVPWQGVPYPPNVILLSDSEGDSDGVQSSYSVEVADLCADSITPTAVQSLYSGQMPQHAWTQSATFPDTGDISAACDALYCWKRVANSQTTEYLSLENVHASSTSTLFTLVHINYTLNSKRAIAEERRVVRLTSKAVQGGPRRERSLQRSIVT